MSGPPAPSWRDRVAGSGTATAAGSEWPPPPRPYDDPDFVRLYDSRYLTGPVNRPHTEFEVGTLEALLRSRTGGATRRTGVGRSARMLEMARARGGFAASFIERDARDLAGIGPAELVTGFWYGYIHQDTLADVDRVLLGMAEATAPGGDLLLGVCDPGGCGRLPRDIPIAYGPSMRIDAVMWSYTEPEGWDCGTMIAPHPLRIGAMLAPMFSQRRWLDYPRSPAAPDWRRRALLLNGRTGGRRGADPSGTALPRNRRLRIGWVSPWK